jgi:hypothetical protein
VLIVIYGTLIYLPISPKLDSDYFDLSGIPFIYIRYYL